MADWAAMVEARDAKIERLRELLQYENQRADAAIDREETAEKAAEEAQAEVERLASLAGYWEHRAEESAEEAAQLRSAWKVSHATGESYRRITRDLNETVRELLSALTGRTSERDRYRLAWLSARRRAADEANFATEALEIRDAHIARLEAQLRDLRESTHAPPRLVAAGSTDDGDEVWRLAEREGR